NFSTGVAANGVIENPLSGSAPITVSLESEVYPHAGADNFIRFPMVDYKITAPANCPALSSYISLNTSESNPHISSDPNFTSEHGVTLVPSAYGMITETDPLSPTALNYAETPIVFTVDVTDTLNHTGQVTRTLYYDDDPPNLITSTASLTVTNNNGASTQGTLIFTTTVTDDSYGNYIGMPNKAYW